MAFVLPISCIHKKHGKANIAPRALWYTSQRCRRLELKFLSNPKVITIPDSALQYFSVWNLKPSSLFLQKKRSSWHELSAFMMSAAFTICVAKVGWCVKCQNKYSVKAKLGNKFLSYIKYWLLLSVIFIWLRQKYFLDCKHINEELLALRVSAFRKLNAQFVLYCCIVVVL